MVDHSFFYDNYLFDISTVNIDIRVLFFGNKMLFESYAIKIYQLLLLLLVRINGLYHIYNLHANI